MIKATSAPIHPHSAPFPAARRQLLSHLDADAGSSFADLAATTPGRARLERLAAAIAARCTAGAAALPARPPTAPSRRRPAIPQLGGTALLGTHRRSAYPGPAQPSGSLPPLPPHYVPRGSGAVVSMEAAKAGGRRDARGSACSVGVSVAGGLAEYCHDLDWLPAAPARESAGRRRRSIPSPSPPRTVSGRWTCRTASTSPGTAGVDGGSDASPSPDSWDGVDEPSRRLPRGVRGAPYTPSGLSC